MKIRWARGFTIVELIIVISSIAIIASLFIIGYNSVQKSALAAAAQSDLHAVSGTMEIERQRTGSYPATMPANIKASNNKLTLTLEKSGEMPFYTGLSTVQNGVLLSQICTDLINDGVGQGVDQGGTTRDYITGCGNWNDDSMQVTGWDTRVWNTPVTRNQLTNYATNYTVSDNFHKQAQETAVKAFYNGLVDRLEAQGGSFPVASFWDYWATPSNGGVMLQPLTSNPQTKPYFCAESSVNNTNSIWHITQENRIRSGGC